MDRTPFVRPDVRVFLDYLANVPGPKMHDLDPVTARQVYVAMKDVADLPAGDLAIKRDVMTPQGVRVRLYDSQATRVPGPVMVFYHGGGFTIGDLESHDGFCAEAARTLDMPVVAVDYRLAPEAPFPAATDDCEAVTRWIATAPAELGVKPTSLVLAGDSAGGNLTVVTAVALRDAPAAVPVIAQWPIYPVVDHAPSYGSFADFGDGYLLTRDSMRYFDDHYAPAAGDLRAYPLGIQSHAGMPATLVVTASLDPLRDQGRAYAAALIHAGVPTVYREARGNIHGFITLRGAIPSSQGDVAACLNILKDIIAEAEAERVMSQAAG